MESSDETDIGNDDVVHVRKAVHKKATKKLSVLPAPPALHRIISKQTNTVLPPAGPSQTAMLVL